MHNQIEVHKTAIRQRHLIRLSQCSCNIIAVDWQVHRRSRMNATQKIVQSQLRHRLSKAASEQGLHYFLWHLALARRFTFIFDLSNSLLSTFKYNIKCKRSPKRLFFGDERGNILKHNVTFDINLIDRPLCFILSDESHIRAPLWDFQLDLHVCFRLFGPRSSLGYGIIERK